MLEQSDSNGSLRLSQQHKMSSAKPEHVVSRGIISGKWMPSALSKNKCFFQWGEITRRSFLRQPSPGCTWCIFTEKLKFSRGPLPACFIRKCARCHCSTDIQTWDLFAQIHATLKHFNVLSRHHKSHSVSIRAFSASLMLFHWANNGGFASYNWYHDTTTHVLWFRKGLTDK